MDCPPPSGVPERTSNTQAAKEILNPLASTGTCELCRDGSESWSLARERRPNWINGTSSHNSKSLTHPVQQTTGSNTVEHENGGRRRDSEAFACQLSPDYLIIHILRRQLVATLSELPTCRFPVTGTICQGKLPLRTRARTLYRDLHPQKSLLSQRPNPKRYPNTEPWRNVLDR